MVKLLHVADGLFLLCADHAGRMPQLSAQNDGTFAVCLFVCLYNLWMFVKKC